jgi:hypothetical protein
MANACQCEDRFGEGSLTIHRFPCYSSPRLFLFVFELASYFPQSGLHRDQPTPSAELSLKSYSSFIDRMASLSYLPTDQDIP